MTGEMADEMTDEMTDEVTDEMTDKEEPSIQVRREMKIARNRAKLVSLGLASSEEGKSEPKQRTPKKKRKHLSPGQGRRSNRISKQFVPFAQLSHFADDEVLLVDRAVVATRRSPKRRTGTSPRKTSSEQPALTADQKKALKRSVGSNYLTKFKVRSNDYRRGLMYVLYFAISSLFMLYPYSISSGIFGTN
jgi:hypothetical protein